MFCLLSLMWKKKNIEIQPGFESGSSSQMLLPTEPLELRALEQRIDSVYS